MRCFPCSKHSNVTSPTSPIAHPITTKPNPADLPTVRANCANLNIRRPTDLLITFPRVSAETLGLALCRPNITHFELAAALEVTEEALAGAIFVQNLPKDLTDPRFNPASTPRSCVAERVEMLPLAPPEEGESSEGSENSEDERERQRMDAVLYGDGRLSFEDLPEWLQDRLLEGEHAHFEQPEWVRDRQRRRADAVVDEDRDFVLRRAIAFVGGDADWKRLSSEKSESIGWSYQ